MLVRSLSDCFVCDGTADASLSNVDHQIWEWRGRALERQQTRTVFRYLWFSHLAIPVVLVCQYANGLVPLLHSYLLLQFHHSTDSIVPCDSSLASSNPKRSKHQRQSSSSHQTIIIPSGIHHVIRQPLSKPGCCTTHPLNHHPISLQPNPNTLLSQFM